MNLNDLPGAELILPGLNDVRHGKMNAVGSLLLLVAIAPGLLAKAGLDVPNDRLSRVAKN
jgi:hypothetical protein